MKKAISIIAWIALLFAVSGIISGQPADKRVALVIGNGAYENLPRLANPSNDASDLSRTLATLGFDVITLIDSSQEEMFEAVEEFAIQHEEVRESYDVARVVSERLASQTRRLETLHRLGRELARHTNVDELADSIMKLLGSHFHFSGCAIHRASGDGSDFEILRRVGNTSAEPSGRHVLRLAY